MFQDELNLLAKLIGTKTEVISKEVFRLHMFDVESGADEVVDDIPKQKPEDLTVNISINSGRQRDDLEKIISEMTVTPEEREEEDLLALMDKAI